MANQFPVKQPTDDDFPGNVAHGFIKRDAAGTAWEEVAYTLVGVMAAEGVAAANAAGTANSVARGDHVHKRYAEASAAMGVIGGGTTTVVETASIPVLMMPFVTGVVTGAPGAWTFVAGAGNGVGNAITQTGTYAAGANTQITIAGHPYAVGDIVGVRGTVNTNGIHTVTADVDANNFAVDDAWVGDEVTGDADAGDKLVAGVGAAGSYLATVVLDYTAAGADVTEFVLYINATAQTHMPMTPQNGGKSILAGKIVIADGDVVSLAVVSNGTDTITVVDANISLVRI